MRGKCPFCGRVFNGDGLLKHIYKQHRYGVLVCPLCGKGCNSMRGVWSHLRMRHGIGLYELLEKFIF